MLKILWLLGDIESIFTISLLIFVHKHVLQPGGWGDEKWLSYKRSPTNFKMITRINKKTNNYIEHLIRNSLWNRYSVEIFFFMIKNLFSGNQ